jgi:Protein of unknown function (DUF2769)
MDRSEEFRKKIAMMDTTRVAAIIAGQKDRCVCAACPTYNECMREKGEVFYCITGRSPVCIFERKTCICPTCPVKSQPGLRKAYYCIYGSG